MEDVLIPGTEGPAEPGAPVPVTANGPPSLGNVAASGMAWLLLQTFGTRGAAFISQLVLARILLPSDFAELALANTVTTVISALAAFGVENVLLQRLKVFNLWAATAFWTSFGFGLLGMAVVFAVAPFAAHIYNAPILTKLLLVMALSMPLWGLYTVPAVLMRAQLNFRFLAIYGTIEFLLIQFMVIALALLGFGVFSFVIPLPIMALVKTILFWLYARPVFGNFRPKLFKVMVARGSSIFGTGLITIAVSQGDYFVLGLLAPKPVVGAYYFAFRLAIQPVQMLAGSLSNVLFPTLAQLQSDPARQRDAVLASSRVLAFAVMPYCFLQAAIARPLFEMFFGAKWELAIPLMQILSVGLAFDCVSWIAASLLSARGQVRRALVYSALLAVAFFSYIVIGTFWDSAVGTAWAVGLFYLTLQPVFCYAVYKPLGISMKQVAMIYAIPVLLAAISVIFAHFVSDVIHSGDAIKILVLLTLGSATYLALARIFAPAIYQQILEKLQTAIKSRRFRGETS